MIIELYSHNDVYDYLRQIALNLCSDKVSEVRWISYKLVSHVAFSLLSKIATTLYCLSLAVLFEFVFCFK